MLGLPRFQRATGARKELGNRGPVQSNSSSAEQDDDTKIMHALFARQYPHAGRLPLKDLFFLPWNILITYITIHKSHVQHLRSLNIFLTDLVAAEQEEAVALIEHGWICCIKSGPLLQRLLKVKLRLARFLLVPMEQGRKGAAHIGALRLHFQRRAQQKFRLFWLPQLMPQQKGVLLNCKRIVRDHLEHLVVDVGSTLHVLPLVIACASVASLQAVGIRTEGSSCHMRRRRIPACHMRRIPAGSRHTHRG